MDTDYRASEPAPCGSGHSAFELVASDIRDSVQFWSGGAILSLSKAAVFR